MSPMMVPVVRVLTHASTLNGWVRSNARALVTGMETDELVPLKLAAVSGSLTIAPDLPRATLA